MSPLALCKDCPTEFDCVEEGCSRARASGPCVIRLTPNQWDHFLHTMQNPKEPTPAMREAARKMAELAKRPGDLEYESWAGGTSSTSAAPKARTDDIDAPQNEDRAAVGSVIR